LQNRNSTDENICLSLVTEDTFVWFCFEVLRLLNFFLNSNVMFKHSLVTTARKENYQN